MTLAGTLSSAGKAGKDMARVVCQQDGSSQQAQQTSAGLPLTGGTHVGDISKQAFNLMKGRGTLKEGLSLVQKRKSAKGAALPILENSLLRSISNKQLRGFWQPMKQLRAASGSW